MDPAQQGSAASSRDKLVRLIEHIRERDGHAGVWLLIVALTGAYPYPGLVRSTRRVLVLEDVDHAIMWLLDALMPLALRHGNAHATLRIIDDRPVVDVHFTARSDFLTGIQRVVRGVAREWSARHDVELAAWTERGGAYRSLLPAEERRLLAIEGDGFDPREGSSPMTSQTEIAVPWGVPIVLTEVPGSELSGRLAAIAEFTDCSLRLVGYDCIPVSSAETVPLAEPAKFGPYLDLVKFSDRLAGISRSATAEFQGFIGALGAQGLVGPTLTTCSLPTTTPVTGEADVEPPSRPVVVCVGTVGRRKNQAALVEAAEMLWREGLDFELRLFGHLGAEATPLTGLVPELRALKRPLVVESGVSDSRIAGTLAQARCLVFPSLHEGFGLPVVEALSHGVPVITSDFGSLREVADGQGGILVDPEDAVALRDALRSLLTDDELHSRLVEQARNRPVRTWTEYADDLWEALVG